MALHATPVDDAPAWLRLSSWCIAFGAGLGGAFGALGEQIQLGAQGLADVRWLAVVATGGNWFGVAVAFIFGLPFVLWFGHALADFRIHWRASRPGAAPTEDDEPDPGEVMLRSPLVDGGVVTLDELDRYVQDGLTLLLLHARAANSLTSSDLIARGVFAGPSEWKWWTDVLAASRLCDKQNGVATVLPPGRTWTWALRQVRQGYFETPEVGTEAALPPLPAPYPPTGAH